MVMRGFAEDTHVMVFFQVGQRGTGELEVSQLNISSKEGHEAISKQAKDQKGIGNSKHGFTKGKPYLTKVSAFCTEMTVSAVKVRAVDAVYIKLKVFNRANS